MSQKIFIILAVLALGLTSYSFADESAASDVNTAVIQSAANPNLPALQNEPPVSVNNTICLISGEKVGEMGEIVTQEYKGKIYNFCCKACLKDFNKDPEKYIKAWEETEDAKSSRAPSDTVEQKK